MSSMMRRTLCFMYAHLKTRAHSSIQQYVVDEDVGGGRPHYEILSFRCRLPSFSRACSSGASYCTYSLLHARAPAKRSAFHHRLHSITSQVIPLQTRKLSCPPSLRGERLPAEPDRVSTTVPILSRAHDNGSCHSTIDPNVNTPRPSAIHSALPGLHVARTSAPFLACAVLLVVRSDAYPAKERSQGAQ